MFDVIATSHAHRGLIWGIVLITMGLFHLTFRRYYARRNAAVQTARKETAISPLRRGWLIPTSEGSNLVLGTAISALMVVAGITVILLAL